MTRVSDRRAATAPEWSSSRWWHGGIIILLLGAVASYGIPLADAGSSGAAPAPIWRYIVQPHIDAADSAWSGHGLRLLLTATLWCLGGALLTTVRAMRAPHPRLLRWQIGLSGLSSSLSIGILVAMHRLLGESVCAPGVVLACIATGAALIGTLTLASQGLKRSS
jgi:hypothetical protein